MFLRNFYKAMADGFASSSSSLVAKTYNGSEKSIGSPYRLVESNSIRTAMKNFHLAAKSAGNPSSMVVIFGDGNTPVTLDDYCLAGEHFTTGTVSCSAVLSDDKSTTTYTYTLTNTGTEAFTVREIGVVTYSSSAVYNSLILREVLESPVTIPANGVGQVTLTLRVNIPA